MGLVFDTNFGHIRMLLCQFCLTLFTNFTFRTDQIIATLYQKCAQVPRSYVLWVPTERTNRRFGTDCLK